ncbi:MAG: hypothetical protein E7A50_02990 [Clostridiales bacterium]|nr:hypothetical protein [Clostridiales bacterium]MDU1028436.1 hypothetical protein [Clostridiales bacterium]
MRVLPVAARECGQACVRSRMADGPFAISIPHRQKAGNGQDRMETGS